ncbi:MAG: hypothetical protein ABEJ75_03270 [Candidatus Nanohaloarchaea archaeon]
MSFEFSPDLDEVLEDGRNVYVFGPGVLEGDGESTMEELLEDEYLQETPDYGPEQVYASD